MVHSERSIYLSLASFDVVLPSEREKQKLNQLNSRDSPLHSSSFAWLVPEFSAQMGLSIGNASHRDKA